MVKKMRTMRTFARTAAKSMEKKLVDNANQIKENPYLILPDYDDRYSQKHFDKIKKTLDKIKYFSGDQSKLEKLSNKKGLDGAVAGTMLVSLSKKAPYLAVAKFSTGDITYAQRGRADKEKLIATQHFDNPILRLLGVKELALRKRLHIYSWDDGFVSTGNEANPPEEFISFLLRKNGFSLKNGVAICGDLKQDVVKNKSIAKKNYLRIHWKSADVIFGICEDCAKSKKNTLFNMTKYILEPDISSDFKIDIIGNVVRQSSEEFQTESLNEYLSGDLTDYDLIKTNMQQREQNIKESGEKILILDGESYGINIEDFVDALKPNKYEKQGLEIILKKVDEPVVFDNATPNKVLDKFWKKYGQDAINSLIDNEEMSKEFFQLDDTPSDILELVVNYKERQKILSQLPSYKSLPPLANFADNIARTYKTFGEKKALTEMKKRPDNPKGKSIAYAFLLAFGKGQDKKWQYSQVEIEYGTFLKEYAKKLLDSKPEKYHDSLKELLISSGSSENID